MPREAAPAGAAPTARELLTARSTAAFLVVVTASSMAAVAQITALGKEVFDLTGSELDLGLLGLAEFLPAAALVLLAGFLFLVDPALPYLAVRPCWQQLAR